MNDLWAVLNFFSDPNNACESYRQLIYGLAKSESPLHADDNPQYNFENV